MPVIIVGAEKNLTALRPRLFAGKVPAATAREVAEAVKAANPHVDFDKLQPGTVVTVPPGLPKVAVGDVSLDDTSRQALAGLVVAGGRSLDELTATAKTRQRELANESKRLAKALDSTELEAAAKREPDVAAALKAVRGAIDEEDARAKERVAALEKARGEWNAELEALKNLVP